VQKIFLLPKPSPLQKEKKQNKLPGATATCTRAKHENFKRLLIIYCFCPIVNPFDNVCKQQLVTPVQNTKIAKKTPTNVDVFASRKIIQQKT